MAGVPAAKPSTRLPIVFVSNTYLRASTLSVSRDLQVNRLIARRRLEERLDEILNGESSASAVRRREAQARENNRFSRAKRRLEMKAAFKTKCLKGGKSSD